MSGLGPVLVSSIASIARLHSWDSLWIVRLTLRPKDLPQKEGRTTLDVRAVEGILGDCV